MTKLARTLQVSGTPGLLPPTVCSQEGGAAPSPELEERLDAETAPSRPAPAPPHETPPGPPAQVEATASPPARQWVYLQQLGWLWILQCMVKLKDQALGLVGKDVEGPGDRATLEVRFGNALASLWMAFQPIVSWRERRVFGYEGLVRTSVPALARPDDFLQAAERLERLRDVGRAVRAHVAAAAVHAPDGALLFTNLHAADLDDEELYRGDSPLTQVADRVVLEITERASLDGVKDLRKRIARLRGMGFRIAVDDLGAGYAGLSSFALLEPEVAKLDMSIVRDVDTQQKKQRIVRSMASLCDELGVLVVTEGVETPGERAMLSELGCDLLQGNLFARPDRGFQEPRWS